jgi:hypothetical protein
MLRGFRDLMFCAKAGAAAAPSNARFAIRRVIMRSFLSAS